MGLFDFLKRKTQTQKSNQTGASQTFSNKYPIVLFENTAINANPPYKILQFQDGVFIQIIDLMCRRFNSISIIGNYSIALFKITADEVEWIKTDSNKLDELANVLYETIPADRFVKASVVNQNNQLIDINVRPLCDSIDNKSNKCTKFSFSIIEDTLSDLQKEKYVYIPVKEGRELTRDDVKDLSLRDIMSAIFVLTNLDESNLNKKSKEAKNGNRGFLLSMAADWLKNNTFYVICNNGTNSPIAFASNGIKNTFVFSSIELANNVINGDEDLCCKKISSEKPELWQALMQKGIAQVIVDCSPMPLTVQGCYIYSMAKTD